MANASAKCCMCGKPINEGESFYRCSVSACNSGRFKLAFCTVACWDAHLPTARHRNASHVEHVAGEENP